MSKIEIDWDAIAPLGKVVVTYHGSGDEGSIEEITPENGERLEYRSEPWDMIEAAAYDILEDHYAGWEINEGSHGDITFDPKERKVFLHHGMIVESTEWSDVVIA